MLRMKNFNILGVYWKIRPLGGGVTKNQYIGGDWPVCWFKGGGLARKGGVFEGGLIPQCPLWSETYYASSIVQ